MAYAIDADTHAFREQTDGLFARLQQRVANYFAYLAIRDELDALSDRALADLGLSRLEVRDVARSAVYGA